MKYSPVNEVNRRYVAPAASFGSNYDEIKVAVTGLGRKAAEAAAEKLLHRYPVHMVISTGFAGALTSEMEAGQLFASDTVNAPDNSPLRTDKTLLERALTIGVGDLRLAALVSVPSLVSDAASRKALHVAHEAQAEATRLHGPLCAGGSPALSSER